LLSHTATAHTNLAEFPTTATKRKNPHGSDIIINIHSVSKLPLRQKRNRKRKETTKTTKSESETNYKARLQIHTCTSSAAIMRTLW
jgi:hypothetical protein